MGRAGLLALVAAAFVAAASGKRSSGSSSVAYSLETYPNPTGEGSRCGPHDRVCDPQRVLSAAAAERIQDAIFALERDNELAHACGSVAGAGYQVAVALVKKMDIPWTSSKESYAETFARGLHDRWGVGHAACDDGVVLFLSVEDRYMFISRGKGAENLVTDDYADAVIDRMKPLLRKALYDEASAFAGCAVDWQAGAAACSSSAGVLHASCSLPAGAPISIMTTTTAVTIAMTVACRR